MTQLTAMSGAFDGMRTIDAAALARLVPMPAAIRAIRDAVRSGFDPDDDPARTIVDVAHGQLLLMPSELGRFAGQKLATVAPGNPARGRERIQAVYVVLDGETLTPVALLDGTELTAIRTPAVSAAFTDILAEPDAQTLVVFGTGPQGIRHVAAMQAIRGLQRVVLVGRDARRARAAADAVAHPGLEVTLGGPADVAAADIVVCATTAAEPLFDASLVRDTATVVAVGSHEPTVRELPGALLERAQVVVETRAVAMTEAGDVVRAVAEGRMDADGLVTMAQLATGAVPVARDRPRVLKTCGMGWQDLAVAAAAMDAAQREGRR